MVIPREFPRFFSRGPAAVFLETAGKPAVPRPSRCPAAVFLTAGSTAGKPAISTLLIYPLLGFPTVDPALKKLPRVGRGTAGFPAVSKKTAAGPQEKTAGIPAV